VSTGLHKHVLEDERHSPFRKVFADATARTADAGPYVAADLYCLAYQIDTGARYVLTATAPTWTEAPGGAPTAHASTHENGGADEINVGGLSGELADPQPPKTHAASHKHGGADEVASAAAGADLIPKAGAGGALAAGWVDDTAHGSRGGGTLHAAATTTVNGFLPNPGAGTSTRVLRSDLTWGEPAGGVFGQGWTTAESAGHSTTTSETFQTKVSATVPGTAGTYMVQWTCAVDASELDREGEVRFQNTTDASTLDGPRIFGTHDPDERRSESGAVLVTITGSSKTVEIQYRDDGLGPPTTIGISEARIHIWRVS